MKRKRKLGPVIGECVGGPCDGLQMGPFDPKEPHDWPDTQVVENVVSRAKCVYELRSHEPTAVGSRQVYYYDAQTHLDVDAFIESMRELFGG
jgi:hypothetical protein